MPGKDASRTALIQVKIVALAPMPKANVATTTKVKPGLLSSVRRLYRKSCQKVSMIRLFLLSTSIDGTSDLANGCGASLRENLGDGRRNRACGDDSRPNRPARYFKATTQEASYTAIPAEKRCRLRRERMAKPKNRELLPCHPLRQLDANAL